MYVSYTEWVLRVLILDNAFDNGRQKAPQRYSQCNSACTGGLENIL